jgi:hypothetical protein
MLFERVGDEEQLVFEAERAGVGDALDQEVARILERGKPVGKGPSRRGVAGAGRATTEELVRPFVVGEAPKAIDGALLGGEGDARRAAGTRLEGLVLTPCAPFPWGEAGRMR